MQPDQTQEKIWIIQRCINAFRNEYEDWPGYCENPMAYDEMRKALKECDEKWGVSHDYEFRGHNIRQSNKVPTANATSSRKINIALYG